MIANTLWRIVLAMCCLGVATSATAQDPHAGHTQPAAAQPAAAKPAAKPGPAEPAPAEDHSAHTAPAVDAPKEPIPTLTDADRAAAFPQGLGGHPAHDRQINTFVLFDQFEWQGDRDGGLTLENKSWVGGDLHRLWVRGEAESEDGRLERADLHVLYGRGISRWWDVVAGFRQDFRPGPERTWAAFGVQGLAPYWFEVEATGYIGAAGQSAARVEVEYSLAFSNKLILQPLIEAEIYGKSDPERRLGAGLSSVETGLRLRYEIVRELAPYVGLTWDRKLLGTADYARADGDDVGAVRLAFGMRTWF